MKKLSGIRFVVILVCLLCVANTSATIRIVAYNTYNNPDNATEDAWFRTIFEAIGQESINGVAKRLDILIVSETDTDSSTRLADILKSLRRHHIYVVHFLQCWW